MTNSSLHNTNDSQIDASNNEDRNTNNGNTGGEGKGIHVFAGGQREQNDNGNRQTNPLKLRPSENHPQCGTD